MENGLQLEPGLIVRKHPPTQEMAVDPARTVERLIAEGGGNDFRHRRVRL